MSACPNCGGETLAFRHKNPNECVRRLKDLLVRATRELNVAEDALNKAREERDELEEKLQQKESEDDAAAETEE